LRKFFSSKFVFLLDICTNRANADNKYCEGLSVLGCRKTS